jgi:hypothetical protein
MGEDAGPKARSRYRIIGTLLLMGSAWAAPAWAQDDKAAAQTDQSVSADRSAAPMLVATHLGGEDAIDLDGRLDEPIWGRAQSATDFRQKEPTEAGPPSERTEVKVVIDSDDLYIGAVLYDSDPDGILAFQRRRDAGLGTDDRFMFILDTFLDGRTGYFFETNPAGLLGDGLIGGGGGRGGGGGGGSGVNKSWDGIWDVRTASRPDGWSVEIRIPFRTLNFNPRLDTWGINFQRTIRRRNEEIQWSGHRRNQPLTQPIHAGRLTGLGRMSQGLGLEFKPYISGSWKNVPEELEPTTYPGNIGGDVQYNITPGLRAALSINTDFAEVEVDQRRVNLTRFPLRFPERRDFFLEGSSVYSFAPRSGPRPYFSRRIGLEEGEQIPIRYGLRLGGQAGDYEIGFIHINTEGQAIIPQEDFTVARLKRNLFEQSSVGVIFTRRATAADSLGVTTHDRYTVGVDANLATSRLFGDKNLQFEAFFVYNTDPERGGEKKSLGQLSARGFRFNYPNDVWEAHLSYREFGGLYDPAVGFVSRNDFRRVEPRIGWNPRPDGIPWLRRFEFDVQYRYLEGLDVALKEEEIWEFGVLGLQFESQDEVSFEVVRTFELLKEQFEISDGIVIDPGQYTTWAVSMRGQTARRRRVSVELEGVAGAFWNGTIRGAELGATFRPTPGLNLSTEFEFNDVRLPTGDFKTSLARLEGGWDVNPLLSFNGSLQYDDVSELVGLFAKVRWILQPGNDLFFVYTHNWLRRQEDVGPGLTSTVSRGVTVKANYTFRF